LLFFCYASVCVYLVLFNRQLWWVGEWVWGWN